MSQNSEIPASAYTQEMETLGALPDISTFDGEPVSRNPLTSGTRPLQLLPLPGTEFPVRYETSWMRGFQAEMRGAAVEVRGASILRMPSFEQLRDAAMELRGAGSEVRDVAVLQGAQLGQSCVMQPCRRVTRLCSCVTQLRFNPSLEFLIFSAIE
ncbi:hypothetical protein JCGZ_14881 [Jatropha curcas]|uniref:Uncharacterized protein n=1 Tax=Jatropha curcas TaxID=180498 RepID=A0A067KB95_JATCU|nr:hypothetical protein JCGZ_14881 [Jatropha curcas]